MPEPLDRDLLIRKTREAVHLINDHICENGDSTGNLALAIDILDHQLGLPCEMECGA